jgi:hypothetical protein
VASFALLDQIVDHTMTFSVPGGLSEFASPEFVARSRSVPYARCERFVGCPKR